MSTSTTTSQAQKKSTSSKTSQATIQAKGTNQDVPKKITLKDGITTIETDTQAIKKQRLEEKIRLFKEKNDLISKLAIFESTKAKLEEVKNIKPVSDFDSSHQIKMTLSRGYRDDLLSISNEEIITELIDLIINKIDEKIQELETQIES